MDQAITLFFNGSHSLYLDAFAWNATQLWVWLPFLLVIVYVLFREHDFSHFLFIILATAICIIVADQIASAVFKPWIARWRPTHTPEIMHCRCGERLSRGILWFFLFTRCKHICHRHLFVVGHKA